MKKIIPLYILLIILTLSQGCKKEISKPAVATADVTNITTNSLTSGGTILETGGVEITAGGVCYGLNPNPDISDLHTSEEITSVSFASNVKGLSPNTLYHIRSYATNAAGTSYGDELTAVTTPIVIPSVVTVDITSVTLTTAVTGGNITADGNDSITARGVCWAITQNPEITNSATADGSGKGSFVSNLTELQPGKTYYLRAYATNSAGTGYGNEISFATNSPSLPSLITTSVSSISLTTAASGGNVLSDGGATITSRGVCWSPTVNPTILNSKTNNGTGTGFFNSNLSALLPGTIYHVRAYATNSTGTAYGNDIPFTTIAVVLPVITTGTVSSINLTTAVSGGTISSDGGGPISAKGVCWSVSVNPTTADFITTNGSGSNDFTSNLSGLLTGTTYYVRAYATNSAGTTYGNQVSFNTKIDDVEGNTYSTVTIGTQVWMAENLRTATFNNHSPITNITANTTWTVMSTPAYCWYNNDVTNKATYGALYNWYTVESGKLCPLGWHVPTDREFQDLELYLGMSPGTASGEVGAWDWRGTNQGTQMKSTSGWSTGNGTNTSRFSALPGGYRYGLSGVFNDLGNLTYWWSSSNLGDPVNATYRRLDGSNNGVFRGAVIKEGGKYVRCMKN